MFRNYPLRAERVVNDHVTVCWIATLLQHNPSTPDDRCKSTDLALPMPSGFRVLLRARRRKGEKVLLSVFKGANANPS